MFDVRNKRPIETLSIGKRIRVRVLRMTWPAENRLAAASLARMLSVGAFAHLPDPHSTATTLSVFNSIPTLNAGTRTAAEKLLAACIGY